MADPELDSLIGSIPDKDKVKGRNIYRYGANPPTDDQLRYQLTDKRDAMSPRIRLEDPTGRLTGSYPRSPMQDIIDVARQAGVDPLLALSMAGQESNFGTAKPWLAHNPLHDNRPSAGGGRIPAVANALSYLKDRGKQFKGDPELQIQAYNGLGRIGSTNSMSWHGPDLNFYGKPPGTLTGRKDRPYGKAVLGIRDWLKDNPAISSLLGEK